MMPENNRTMVGGVDASLEYRVKWYIKIQWAYC